LDAPIRHGDQSNLCCRKRQAHEKNQTGVLDSYLIQVAPQAVRLGPPKKISLADDQPTLI
jgi:hypothetical protein